MLKSMKCCLGVVFLSLGLSACWDDMHRSEHTDGRYYEQMNKQNEKNMQNKQQHDVKKSQPKQKTYPSKDPTQQATPGPARQGAPQLPVIH